VTSSTKHKNTCNICSYGPIGLTWPKKYLDKWPVIIILGLQYHSYDCSSGQDDQLNSRAITLGHIDLKKKRVIDSEPTLLKSDCIEEGRCGPGCNDTLHSTCSDGDSCLTLLYTWVEYWQQFLENQTFKFSVS
jgi:hypothetical protein